MRIPLLILLSVCGATAAFGDGFVVVSSASGTSDLALGALATAIGFNLPAGTDTSTLQVIDSAGTVRTVKTLYASQTQINFQLPSDMAAGEASFQISSGLTSSGMVQTVAPALFTANESGTGVVAATAFRKVIPTNFTSPVTVYDCSAGPGSCVPVPIDVGVDAPVSLVLYVTGVRGRSSDSAITVTIGGVPGLVQSIIPGDNGVDQIVVGLPISLRGRGLVDVVLTVDGKSSNAGQISIQ